MNFRTEFQNTFEVICYLSETSRSKESLIMSDDNFNEYASRQRLENAPSSIQHILITPTEPSLEPPQSSETHDEDDALPVASSVTPTDFCAYMDNQNISLEKRRTLLKLAFYGKTQLSVANCESLYMYLNLLDTDEIDEIYRMQPNLYMFFKNLGSYELVQKYFIRESNALHGISKNTFLTPEQRRSFLFY